MGKNMNHILPWMTQEPPAAVEPSSSTPKSSKKSKKPPKPQLVTRNQILVDEVDATLFDRMGTGMRAESGFHHAPQLMSLALNVGMCWRSARQVTLGGPLKIILDHFGTHLGKLPNKSPPESNPRRSLENPF